MSDDLISRKSLIKNLKKSLIKNLKKFAPEHYTALVNDLIMKEPTAFDKEKVIEELKELKMMYFLTIANTGDEKMDLAYEKVGNALDKAIEIIEKGGIE